MTGTAVPLKPQGAPFAFDAANEALATRIIARYPQGRQASAVIPLLDLAQRQCGGWLPKEAVEYMAERLLMPLIRVYEVVTFYTMFNLSPVGKHVIGVCTTTPCALRGSAEIVDACRKRLGVDLNETTADGMFTLTEVECLGACVNAPMAQIGDDFYEDLDAASMTRIIDAFARDETPNPGPQSGRRTSEPLDGPTTLREFQGKTR
ncbi:MAG TPA: NADH-quinone oxidoreductase subunit NuoE [Alphaproteobacteria bacterium]|jgi:NADH-quinone oxidoreductase subunit E|nr:NADH-quinone oxidoreductase subunit NuoE [Alphaproteobacteria bacterium]